MKIKYVFIFSLVAVISSCTTAYRSGQTPDDVYFSPAPEQNSYVNSVNDRDRNSYSYRNDEESEIRRGIQNPVYRNSIALNLGLGYSPYAYSPFGYSPYNYSPYGYGGYGYDPYMSHGMYSPYSYNSFGYNNFYSPYSFYNPGFYGSPYYGYGYGYYTPGLITLGRANTNTGPRRYNLNTYNNNSVNNSPAAIRNAVRSNISSGSAAPVRSFNTQPRSSSGNVIRRVFTPSESRRNNSRNSNNTYESNRTSRNDNYNTRQERPTYQAPTRSFESSSPSSSSSSSGSNNSSAPVRSFRR